VTYERVFLSQKTASFIATAVKTSDLTLKDMLEITGKRSIAYIKVITSLTREYNEESGRYNSGESIRNSTSGASTDT
jgi:hypothetical protein